MTAPLLILRPQPGAEETAERARSLGLEPVVAPLFEIRPLRWSGPGPEAVEAVLMTSANAARLGGAGLRAYRELPCYAVGEATAAAARRAGFGDLRVGPADGAALLEMMAADGVRRAFHPSGRDHVGLGHPLVAIDRSAVYAADPVERLPPEAETALEEPAVALLHSPRAAALFADLVAGARSRVAIAAISEAAASAAGAGWRRVAVAERPREEALLELAVRLCQTGRR